MPKLVATVALAVCFAAVASAAGEESFDYRVEWKLWHAGDIHLVYAPPAEGTDGLSTAAATLKTRGVVDDLYGVDNHYTVRFDGEFCSDSYLFKVKEGKKRRRITTDYRQRRGRAILTDRDLVKKRIASRKSIRTPECVHDELTALARFRSMELEPGESVELPVSNGKKSVVAKIVRQSAEKVKLASGEVGAIRYEVFLFNNVLYRRKGRLFMWLTDDERRVPVQFQVRLRLYGTVTLKLVTEDKP